MRSPDGRTEFQRAWERLRYPIKAALREILEMKAGHYVAMLVIAIACEGLSRLLARPDHHIFVEELVMPHRKITSRMAVDLWEALRHGLVHTYETKFIQVGRERVEIMISWREFQHLSRRDAPLGIYLNVHTMHHDLENVLGRYHRQFSQEPNRVLPRDWIKRQATPATSGSLADWREFFDLHSRGANR